MKMFIQLVPPELRKGFGLRDVDQGLSLTFVSDEELDADILEHLFDGIDNVETFAVNVMDEGNSAQAMYIIRDNCPVGWDKV